MVISNHSHALKPWPGTCKNRRRGYRQLFSRSTSLSADLSSGPARVHGIHAHGVRLIVHSLPFRIARYVVPTNIGDRSAVLHLPRSTQRRLRRLILHWTLILTVPWMLHWMHKLVWRSCVSRRDTSELARRLPVRNRGWRRSWRAFVLKRVSG